MAKNYTITFMPLRAAAGDDPYVVNIGGGTGTAVPLKGGAQPFTTQEDDDDDMFIPVRTQSGYLRIVDDGLDANGSVIDATLGQDWWKDLVPSTAFGRPVTLTKGGTVMWQGYIQTQTFSGALYGNPQEREFPVICPLAVLDAKHPDTNERSTKSFAYLLWTILTAAQTTNTVTFDNIYFQGGVDARFWLGTYIDFKNFYEFDSEGEIKAKYSKYQILEEVCKFWGWTVRTCGRDVYFTCADDVVEQSYLQVTLSQLQNLGPSTGDVIAIPSVSLSGDIFASTDNEDHVINGPSRAIVKADVNKQDTILLFAPIEFENQMDVGGYTWQQGQEDLTGLFTTPIVQTLPTSGLSTANMVARVVPNGGITPAGSGFCRQQIFASTDSTDAEKVDAIFLSLRCINTNSGLSIDHQIEIDSIYPMDYTGGSFKFKGKLFDGYKQYTDGNELHMRFGLGESRSTCQWWYMNPIPDGGDINCGWSSNMNHFIARLEGGNIFATAAYHQNSQGMLTDVDFKSTTIPAPDSGGYGRLFIDIIGCGVENFTIGDFEVEFSRDATFIPLNVHAVRPRVMETKFKSDKEYTSDNWNQSMDEWSVDTIFASDNNLEFGYGMLLNDAGGYVSTLPYNSLQSPEHPEQHLANRVSAYYADSKCKLITDLRYNLTAVRSVLPHCLVSMKGMTLHPININHNWRDDTVQIGFMEI